MGRSWSGPIGGRIGFDRDDFYRAIPANLHVKVGGGGCRFLPCVFAHAHQLGPALFAGTAVEAAAKPLEFLGGHEFHLQPLHLLPQHDDILELFLL